MAREVRIQVHSAQISGFQVRMERVVEHWQQISGLFFEWDGSLTLAQPQLGWECHGNLYDSGDRVQYLELQLRLVASPGNEDGKPWVEALRRLLMGLLADDSDRLDHSDPSKKGKLDKDGRLDAGIRIQRLPEFQFQSWTEFVDSSDAWKS